MISESTKERSTMLAVQEMILDPLTPSTLELPIIVEITEELFDAESEWLPDWLQ